MKYYYCAISHRDIFHSIPVFEACCEVSQYLDSLREVEVRKYSNSPCVLTLSWRALSEAPRHSFFATPPGGPSDPSRALPPRRSSLCPTVPPSPPGARALLPITRARGGGEPSWTPPPLPPRPALLTPLPGGPLHPPSALALWDPVEPSRRRSDGDPSSPVGWRALRSEGWKWEGSRTDPSRSGRVEGWRVEGWRGG